MAALRSIFVLLLASNISRALSLDTEWTKLFSFTRPRLSLVSASANGSALIVAQNEGPIYYSTNYGKSWNKGVIPISSKKDWYGVASRADGMIAIAQQSRNGSLFISKNFGAEWRRIVRSPSCYWNGITASAEGSRWFATANRPNRVYTSTNGGYDWISLPSAPGDAQWSGIACARNCSLVYASDELLRIHKSSDAGVSWSEISSAPKVRFSGITASKDGTRVAATAMNGSVFLSSDSGVSWKDAGAQINEWQYISSNFDLSTVVASDNLGSVWRSTALYPPAPAPSFRPVFRPRFNVVCQQPLPPCPVMFIDMETSSYTAPDTGAVGCALGYFSNISTASITVRAAPITTSSLIVEAQEIKLISLLSFDIEPYNFGSKLAAWKAVNATLVEAFVSGNFSKLVNELSSTTSAIFSSSSIEDISAALDPIDINNTEMMPIRRKDVAFLYWLLPLLMVIIMAGVTIWYYACYIPNKERQREWESDSAVESYNEPVYDVDIDRTKSEYESDMVSRMSSMYEDPTQYRGRDPHEF